MTSCHQIWKVIKAGPGMHEVETYRSYLDEKLQLDTVKVLMCPAFQALLIPRY